MSRWKYEEFLATLTDCDGPGSFPIIDAQIEVEYPQGLAEFVGPDVSDSSHLSNNPELPQVVIISSPGATGKSTLGRQIGYVKNAPRWDLALSGPVGQRSLDGLLINLFGAQASSELTTALNNGRQFIIIDALDEARLKSNEAGFLAMLKDVARYAKGASGTCFVLLGRTQASDTAWLALEEEGIRTSLLVIEPFTRDQGNEYIEKRIPTLGERASSIYQTYKGPLEECRDLIFEQLELALNQIEDQSSQEGVVNEFLGYPPVLDAVAVLLGFETNFAGLRSMLLESQGDTTDAKGRSTALLKRIIDRILDREKDEKLVHNLRPVLEPMAAALPWNDWNILYTPEEQTHRLLGLVLGSHVEATPGMPDALKDEYEAGVSGWLREHPFLRDGTKFANSVFESFAYSLALRDNVGGFGNAVAQKLSVDPLYRPSSLMAEFYFSESKDHDMMEIPPEHLGILYDSFQSSESDKMHVRLTVDGLDPTEVTADSEWDAEGEFEILSDVLGEAEFGATRTIAFRMHGNSQSKVSFSRYIRDSSLRLPCTVRLGGLSPELELGPAVNIRARELMLLCTSLVVGGKSHFRAEEVNGIDVVLEATQIESAVATRPVCFPPVKLVVSFPGAEGFPWTEFRSEALGDTVEGWDDKFHDTYLRFRRIANTLQSHKHGVLAKTRHKIEHQRVLDGELGHRLLDRLLADRILTLRSGFYYWDDGIADSLLGISWQQLRSGHTTGHLTDYLAAFINDNRDIFSSPPKG